jgi:hypothetical protein
MAIWLIALCLHKHQSKKVCTYALLFIMFECIVAREVAGTAISKAWPHGRFLWCKMELFIFLNRNYFQENRNMLVESRG